MIAQHSDFGSRNMLLARVDTLLLDLVSQLSNMTLQTNHYEFELHKKNISTVIVQNRLPKRVYMHSYSFNMGEGVTI